MQKGPEIIKFGVIKSLLFCHILRVFSWPFCLKSMTDMNGGGTFLQKNDPPKFQNIFHLEHTQKHIYSHFFTFFEFKSHEQIFIKNIELTIGINNLVM